MIEKELYAKKSSGVTVSKYMPDRSNEMMIIKQMML